MGQSPISNNKLPRLDRRDWLVMVGLAGVVAAVYAQAAGFDFVLFDDDRYITDNTIVVEGLNSKTAWWALTTFTGAHWHPLTWLSYLLDVSIYGAGPRGFHITNIVFHVLSTMLLFRFFRLYAKSLLAGLFVAGIFGLHPIHVESVAWIAERKDVLFAFFWIATLNAWGAWVTAPSRRRYALVCVFFLLGILSKPMIVTLPFTLLLMDIWPLNRLRFPAKLLPTADELRSWWARIREKGLFFALMLVPIASGFHAQSSGGAVKTVDQFPLWTRLANVPLAYADYLKDAFWPDVLVFLHVHPGTAISVPAAIATFVLLALVTGLLWLGRGRAAGLPCLVGWLWFLGTLVPVIGLVQIGAQSHADRFVYVPLIGISLAVAMQLSRLERAAPRAGLGVATAVILIMGIRTYQHLPVWRNTETLFVHAIDNGVRHSLVHSNLSVYLSRVGRMDDAVEQCRQAVALDPNDSLAANNLGESLLRVGKLEEADRVLSELLARQSLYSTPMYNLGLVRRHRKMYDDALVLFRELVRRKPTHTLFHSQIIQILTEQGRFEEAETALQTAEAAVPGSAELAKLRKKLAIAVREAEKE
jgi:tetratricopeptide (TPR) repeat protein